MISIVSWISSTKGKISTGAGPNSILLQMIDMNIDRTRVKTIKTNVVIVHRRKGREKVRSDYERDMGYSGKWKTVCQLWTTYGVNTTTKDNEVTCLRCLRRMS